MPPARMQRHLQRRIIFADHLGDDVGCVIELIQMEREICEVALLGRGQHLVCALAHGVGGEKGVGDG